MAFNFFRQDSEAYGYTNTTSGVISRKQEYDAVAVGKERTGTTTLPAFNEHESDFGNLDRSADRGSFLNIYNDSTRMGNYGEATAKNERTGGYHSHLPSTYPSTMNARLIRGPIELASSIGSHESESSLINFVKHNGNSPSTPEISIGEGILNPGREEGGREGKSMSRKIVAGDDSFFLGLTQEGGLALGQATQHQSVADVETVNNVMSLDKTQPKLSPQISHALGRVDTAFDYPPDLLEKTDTTLYRCKTESDSITSIYLHITLPHTIYRWKKGSIITFNVNHHSFEHNTEHANFAATSLEHAAKRWNKGKFGVKLKRVRDDEDCVFQLVYSAGAGANPGRLAEAFFPGDPLHKHRLLVYQQAFDRLSGDYDLMTNIFCHELGHILGLRHEFAKMETEPSVQLGKDNPLSIMEYGPLGQMHIHQDDYAEIREFYNLHQYGGYNIRELDAPSFHP
ncbi:hypothetical protein F5Y04DRAFT_248222 [Hypomontagnella monticulosa]|nr:hypothetical protein F5Y04DRAFT_248222 [Hypomontagnella monticulosa]